METTSTPTPEERSGLLPDDFAEQVLKAMITEGLKWKTESEEGDMSWVKDLSLDGDLIKFEVEVNQYQFIFWMIANGRPLIDKMISKKELDELIEG